MGGTRLAGLRRSWTQRSRKEKTAGLAAAALLASAPFGGLDAAGEEPPETLRLNDTVTIGPYDVTFLRAYRVSEYAGTRVQPWEAPPVKPSAPGRRLLVLEVDVVNDGTRPEYAHVLTKAVSIGGVAKVDSFGGPSTRPGLVQRADGSHASTLNPGLRHRLALVAEQRTGVDTPTAAVSISRMMYVGEGGLASNLDEDYWLHLDGTARRGTLAVGSRPKAER